MKTIIVLLILAASTISANIMNAQSPSQRLFKKEQVAIFKGPDYGEIPADFLFLKRGCQSYDLVWSYRRASHIGHYEIVGDTLKLNKEYLFFNGLIEIDKSETTFDSITLMFLIQNDELIDVTNYEEYDILRDFFSKGEVFKRLKFE